VIEDSVLTISQLPAGLDSSPLWELLPRAGEMAGRLFVFYNVGIPSALTNYLTNKGRMLNTLENYHIYIETVAGNQINDKQTSKSNKIFETVLKHDPQK